MKKWIFICLAIILVMIWQSIDIYQSARAEKLNPMDVAKHKAEEKYPIQKINQVTFYHGQKGYHVINADLKNGSHVFIWVPDKDSEGQYLMIPVSDGFSKSEILKAFQTHIAYKKIVSIRLGMENETPAWEITYIDTDGGYVFSYYDFISGEKVIDPISIH